MALKMSIFLFSELVPIRVKSPPKNLVNWTHVNLNQFVFPFLIETQAKLI